MVTLESLNEQVLAIQKILQESVTTVQLPDLTQLAATDLIAISSNGEDFKTPVKWIINNSSQVEQSLGNFSKGTIIRYTDQVLADKSDNNVANYLLGMVTEDVQSGNNTRILLAGILQNVTWNWDVTTPLWLGNNGNATQVEPVSGVSMIIGKAMSPTEVFFNPLQGELII